ncbi:G2/mitotic-specific cyclin-B3 [Ochotona curzoniae]|uniref:G2/mitotic-specific cyclin-B3 n=1 Tax=Ochotona curzoniae TaxID=130825 RepID=UPI001B34C454|nr:G2/mitotic-specific cyclin-B3 [Ochotona curzoniae]
MPLPVPPPIPKRVPKKPQSSKSLLNDRDSPEKRAMIPSSSPRGVLSMRLALEDVTNAYPFQFVQSKRGDEFAKHASKKANKNMSLSTMKSSKMNSDRYKSKPLAVVSSTPPLKNKEKLDILERATISKVPEETCVLKGTLTTERITFINDQESSCIKRKVASHKRMSVFQKSSPSQRGTDRENNVNMDVATVDKKSKTKKTANTKRTSSPEEKTFIPGIYKFDLNDFLCNSDSSEDEFIFTSKSRKKAKMEKPTIKPLSSETCTPRGNTSQVKPQVSQQVTYANKPLPKEPLSLKKRKPAPEKESPSQGSCALQEKHTNQKARMYKYYIFQDSPSDEESVSQKVLVLDKEAAPTSDKLLRKCKKYRRRVAIHCEPLESQPVCPTTEKKTLSKMPLLSNQEQVTQEQLSPLKKRRQSQKGAFKEESMPEKLPSKQQFSNAREFLLKDPPTLKEKKTTTDEPSYVQEPLTWKTKPTGDEIYFSPELFSPPMSPYKDESFSRETLLLPEKTGTKEDSFNKQLISKGQNLTEEESFFNKLLGLKEPSTGAAMSTERQLSSEKKSTTQGVALLMSNQMTKPESITDGKESSAKQPLAFNHEKQPPLQDKLPPDEDNLSQGPLIFREMARVYETPMRKPCASQSKSSSESEKRHQQCLSFQELFGFDEECLSQGPVLLEDRARMRGVVVDEPLSVPKTPSLRKETPSEKQLYFQEKLLLEEDNISQEPLIFPEAEATDEAAKCEPWTVSWVSSPKGAWYKQQHALDEKCLPQGSALFEDSSTMRGIILNEPQTVPKTPGLDYETFSKQQASSREKRSPEEDSLSQVPLIFREMARTNQATVKEPWAIQQKPSTEKATLKETVALQEEPAVNKLWLLEEASALNENPIARKKLLFEDPMAVADESIYRNEFFLKALFAMPTVNSSPVFGSTVFGGDKSTVTRKSSVWDSTPDTLGSSHEQRTQIQMMKSLMEEANRYYNDPFLNSAYVNDIFNYLKEREEMFILTKYMSWQPEINSDMRAILVDWLVELQINFETSHETLYLAVKLVDHYLNEAICEKDKLQLLGCTAFMIAAKFEETSNLCVSDFLYICDDSYVRNEILAMEACILKTLKFDINIPTAYHFLRRYARCMKVSMRTLTLSRFVCEMTLQKYDYVQERASKLAAGALLLALYMKNLRSLAPFLEFHSGYKVSELYPLVKQLNGTLTLHFRDKLKTVYSKYSQKDFFEVSKIPPLEMCTLEKIFKG